MMMPKEPTIIELNMSELEELLRRVEAKQLEDGDSDNDQDGVSSLTSICSETLKDKNVSMRRLRKTLFGATTEKTASILGDEADSSTPSPV